MKIEQTKRINLGVRMETHDDNGRGAIKNVPVYRVKIVQENKYSKQGAEQ